MKFLVGENLATFFKCSRKVFLKPAYPIQSFKAGFHNLRRAVQKHEVELPMDSKLEGQRSVIKFLLLEGEKPYQMFSKVAEKFFLKPAYPVQVCTAGFHSLGRAGQVSGTSLGQGGQLRQ